MAKAKAKAKAVAKRKRRKPPAKRNGRPTKLTQPVADRITEGVSLGMTYREAAMAGGIHEDTLDVWRRRGAAESNTRAPLRIRDLTEDDWLNGLWPSAAMLAPEFPGVSRAPIELSPLQDRAQAISYSEYCHTAAARRSSWTRRRML